MENEFVKYNEALALKELGFDEPCMAIYYSKDKSFSWHHHKDHTNDEPALESGEFNISAPTWSAAFRWFREKHGLIGGPIPLSTVPLGVVNHYGWAINSSLKYTDNWEDDYEMHKTYEEAELECLKQLIKIVKEKK